MNFMRPIDADRFQTVALYNVSDDFIEGVSFILEEIAKSPTVDVRNTNQGSWSKHYKSGTIVSEGFISSCCDKWNSRASDFCPDCGAYMTNSNNHLRK